MLSALFTFLAMAVILSVLAFVIEYAWPIAIIMFIGWIFFSSIFEK